MVKYGYTTLCNYAKGGFNKKQMKTLKNFNCEEAKEICMKAYEALIKYDISMLPAPVEFIPGILIVSIQVFATACNMSEEKAIRQCGHRGIVYYADEVDKYVILYNYNDPIELRRWIITLGIGYIELWKELNLSHLMKRTYISLNNSHRTIDEFAYSFTGPDIVLEECEMNTVEEIIAFCGIPFNHAREKFKRLKIESSDPNSLELRINGIIKDTFSAFIKNMKRLKEQKQKMHKELI